MKPELLSPVGSEESLYAAVRSGADAVYMGYGNFNARRSAQNFDDSSFERAVEYCHIRGVKVYLTLNTLLYDGELSAALDTAKKACKAGADGFIVADLGLARLLKSACPEMPLHASTQMTVTSPSALGELKKLGFVRAVLAREMSMREIAEACDEAHRLSMETEAFVHGALCMCVSGQCYMSAVIGRRSGNRGLCAQPCRLPARDGGYPLSLKDLSLISYVRELTDIGVDSFKIEGRMKRPEYIAASTASFRQMLDFGSADAKLLERLDSVFSRSGHTDGYFTAERDASMFGHRTESDVAASNSALSGLREIYRAERQNIAVSVSFAAKLGENMRMTMSDGENTVSCEGEVPQPATGRAADSAYIRSKCEKLGGTPYYCEDFDCDTDGKSAVSASAVNAMRRECVRLLDETRKPKPVPFYDIKTQTENREKCGKTGLFARFSDISRVPDNLTGLEMIFVPADTPEKELSELIGRADGGEIGVELPRALFSLETACERWLSSAKALGVRWAMCHNIAAVNIANRLKMRVLGGFGLNVLNSQSAQAASEMGAELVTLSFESAMGRLANITGDNLGIVAYGRLPLMLTRSCPAQGGKAKCGSCTHDRSITDRVGQRFPIECRYAMSEVLNSKVLWLSDRRDKMLKYRFLMLNFTDETKKQAEYVISAYLGEEKPHGDFTRGLYDRGVL